MKFPATVFQVKQTKVFPAFKTLVLLRLKKQPSSVSATATSSSSLTFSISSCTWADSLSQDVNMLRLCESEPIHLQTLKESPATLRCELSLHFNPSLWHFLLPAPFFFLLTTWRVNHMCDRRSWIPLCASPVCCSTLPPWGLPTCPWPRSREDSLGTTSRRRLTAAPGRRRQRLSLWSFWPPRCPHPALSHQSSWCLGEQALPELTCAYNLKGKKTDVKPKWVIFWRSVADWQRWQCVFFFFMMLRQSLILTLLLEWKENWKVIFFPSLFKKISLTAPIPIPISE